MPKSQIGFVLALVLLAAPAAVASAGTGQSEYEREQVMSAQFDIHPGGTLVVDVPDADVTLRNGSDDRVEIEVWLEARDMERARDRFERMGFNAKGNGDRVQLTAERIRGNGWDWRDWGRFNISVEIVLPRQYDVDLKTGDGDVSVQSQEGVIRLQKSVEPAIGPPAAPRQQSGHDVRARHAELLHVVSATSLQHVFGAGGRHRQVRRNSFRRPVVHEMQQPAVAVRVPPVADRRTEGHDVQ